MPTDRCITFRAWDFEFVSDFDIRISDFSPRPIMPNKPNPSTAAPLFTIHRSLFTILRNKPNCRPTGKCPRTGTACRAPTSQNKPNLPPTAVSLAPPPPQMRKTNPIHRAASILPASHPRLLRKTNPISVLARHAVPLQCETNPIPVPPSYRCRLAGLPTPRIMRNEPNFRTAAVSLASPAPIMRNEPNFIPRPAPNTQNKPNLPPSCLMPIASCLNYAKRTQFPARRPEY